MWWSPLRGWWKHEQGRTWSWPQAKPPTQSPEVQKPTLLWTPRSVGYSRPCGLGLWVQSLRLAANHIFTTRPSPGGQVPSPAGLRYQLRPQGQQDWTLLTHFLHLCPPTGHWGPPLWYPSSSVPPTTLTLPQKIREEKIGKFGRKKQVFLA